ncbi:MAG: hypothetical protein M3Q36_01010 [bacterium]|nr:hypothetical protein [bacterium]
MEQRQNPNLIATADAEPFTPYDSYEQAIELFLSDGALAVDALMITYYRYGNSFDAMKLAATKQYLRQRPSTSVNEHGEPMAMTLEGNNIQAAAESKPSKISWHPEDDIKLLRASRQAARNSARNNRVAKLPDAQPTSLSHPVTEPLTTTKEAKLAPKFQEFASSERQVAKEIIDYFIDTVKHVNKIKTFNNLFENIESATDIKEFREILRKLEARQWLSLVNPSDVRRKRKGILVKLFSQEFKEAYEKNKQSMLAELNYPLDI